MRVVMIDNYDSFTWNLVHLFQAVGADVRVARNDARTPEDVLADEPDAIVLSPGPGTPNDAGICLDLIRAADGNTPIFGVCLGLQAIGQAYGGRVVRAPTPMHGKVSPVTAAECELFRGIERPFAATRYHSLVVEDDSLPPCLEPVARTEDGLLMAASHRSAPVHGVQFHPESVASECGEQIAQNFLALARRWNDARRFGRRAA